MSSFAQSRQSLELRIITSPQPSESLPKLQTRSTRISIPTLLILTRTTAPPDPNCGDRLKARSRTSWPGWEPAARSPEQDDSWKSRTLRSGSSGPIHTVQSSSRTKKPGGWSRRLRTWLRELARRLFPRMFTSSMSTKWSMSQTGTRLKCHGCSVEWKESSAADPREQICLPRCASRRISTRVRS